MAKYWQAGDRDRKITVKQMSLLHVARAKLGLTESDYRSVLSLYGSVESSKELSIEGFRNVLAYFERVGFENPNGFRQTKAQAVHSDPDALPTPAQLNRMQELFAMLGMETAKQQEFSKRQIKKTWAQTRAEANKIIEGLKAMVARRKKSVE